MISQTPNDIDGVVALGHKCLSGSIALELEVGIKLNTAATIAADLYDLVGQPGTDPETAGKSGVLNQARITVTTAAEARRQAVKTGRTFNAKSIDHLKGFFGRRWTPLWQSVGLTSGSLALPSDPLPLLLKLRAHWIANPAHELVGTGLTAAMANLTATSIQGAFAMEGAAVNARNDASEARDESFVRLRRRLVGLRAELNQLLDDDDYRWNRFGFNRPVDRHIPAMPSELVLRAGGTPGEIIATWQPAVGADNYRVRRQVQGVDVAPIEIGLLSDPTAIIGGLPTGSTVTVMLTARNEAGETQPISATMVVA